jgi:glucokinase
MQTFLCGVDIGGTKLSVGLVKETGEVLDQITVYDHVKKAPDLILEQIVALVHQLLEKHSLKESQLKGIGVATAGHLRYRDGVLITMSNLEGFRNFPIRDRLQARFSVPVEVDNDANAQTLAESKFGAGRGYRDMIFMTISTQIGAGIVLGGTLFRGMTGTAGEIGHTIVDPHSDLVCPCGNRGCLIALASGVSLPLVVARKLREGMTSLLVSLSTLDKTPIDGNFIREGLARGDGLCRSVVDEYAGYLGIAVYNLFQIFNPEAVVLGGGLTQWGDPLFDGIRSRFRELARDMMFDPMVIVPGTVANSGLVGAASLVADR